MRRSAAANKGFVHFLRAIAHAYKLTKGLETEKRIIYHQNDDQHLYGSYSVSIAPLIHVDSCGQLCYLRIQNQWQCCDKGVLHPMATRYVQ